MFSVVSRQLPGSWQRRGRTSSASRTLVAACFTSFTTPTILDGVRLVRPVSKPLSDCRLAGIEISGERFHSPRQPRSAKPVCSPEIAPLPEASSPASRQTAARPYSCAWRSPSLSPERFPFRPPARQPSRHNNRCQSSGIRQQVVAKESRAANSRNALDTVEEPVHITARSAGPCNRFGRDPATSSEQSPAGTRCRDSSGYSGCALTTWRQQQATPPMQPVRPTSTRRSLTPMAAHQAAHPA